MSSFAPTVRFGLMMAAILSSSIWAGLIQLPALLALLPGNRQPKSQTLSLPVSEPADAQNGVRVDVRKVA